MLSWEEFASIKPEMASFGQKRLELGVMYLATVKQDGYPRVHPFTPFVGSGRLFAFMESTSPKGKDLQRNGKYSMHSLVANMSGDSGEFQIGGKAFLLTDLPSRESAIRSCPYKPKDHYILFEFKIENCLTNSYGNEGPNVNRWKENGNK